MFRRTIALIGDDLFKLLQTKKVLVFGLGGVGGYVCEMLVRSGIKNIGICDFDVVSLSNKNRQIIALDSTIGFYKTDVMEKRLKDINSEVIINKYNFKIDENSINKIETDYDYYIDCIDDVKAKIMIILKAVNNNIKIISSMGTGNKLDPNKFKIDLIKNTKVCPLAKVMRKKLKDLGITDVVVLYSEEETIVKEISTIPSIAFCPSTAGILIARWVILDIIGGNKK